MVVDDAVVGVEVVVLGDAWMRSLGVIVAVELFAEILPRFTCDEDMLSKCFSSADLGITAFAAAPAAEDIIAVDGNPGLFGLGTDAIVGVRFFAAAAAEACIAA